MRFALERDGALVRTGVRAVRARAGAGTDGAHVIELDDGSTAEGHVILLAVGRDVPARAAWGSSTTASPSPDPTRTSATAASGSPTGCGPPATRPGPSSTPTRATTRASWSPAWRWAKAIVPDYRALPRATYMEPESASVGVSLDQATAAGLDAFECVADFTKSAKGYSVEADTGHVTIVVDRATRELVGAAMACPDASAAIHECVLAIKAHVKIDVLAETIHAFPSTSRILNGLFAEARTRLRETA